MLLTDRAGAAVVSTITSNSSEPRDNWRAMNKVTGRKMKNQRAMKLIHEKQDITNP